MTVGTHEGASPCNLSMQLVPWSVYTTGLVAGTCPTNSSHEAFWGSRRDLSQKFKTVSIRGTSRNDWILFPATGFWGKNGQFTRLWELSQPCNLLQGLMPLCAPILSAFQKHNSPTIFETLILTIITSSPSHLKKSTNCTVHLVFSFFSFSFLAKCYIFLPFHWNKLLYRYAG